MSARTFQAPTFGHLKPSQLVAEYEKKDAEIEDALASFEKASDRGMIIKAVLLIICAILAVEARRAGKEWHCGYWSAFVVVCFVHFADAILLEAWG